MATFNSAGLYDGARYVAAHASRVGGQITPRAVVVHDTDMVPNGFAGLVRAWSMGGPGPCAHFIIGRDATQGLVQMVPIIRNGEHAGGAVHGNWVTPDGSKIHPNSIAVGIEVHTAGRLDWKSADRAVLLDKHIPVAEFSVAAGEVFVDDLGRPWHMALSYQLDTLAQLLTDLHGQLGPLQAHPVPDAALVKDRSKWDMSWAAPVCTTLVGHASIDPINKTDPGPQLMTFINDLARKANWK